MLKDTKNSIVIQFNKMFSGYAIYHGKLTEENRNLIPCFVFKLFTK